MWYSKYIALPGSNLLGAVFLCMPWTLLAALPSQIRLPHLSAQQSAELEAGKQAAVNATSDSESPENRAAKKSLEALSDDGLLAFSVRLRKLAVVNPESLDKLLGEVPVGESAGSLRNSLQALVQTDPEAKATLTGLVKEILLSRLEGEGKDASLSERLAELERREKQREEDFLRGLEDKIALENLLGGNAGSESGQSPAGASPTAASGSSPSTGKSKEGSYPRDEKHNDKKSADSRLNEILKSLDSNKADNASTEKNETTAQSPAKKKTPAIPENPPASNSAASTPQPAADDVAQSYSKPKPALTGNVTSLSPLSPPGAVPSGATGGNPQAGSFGPMQGSIGSGVAAAAAGQAFPFFTSDPPGAPPAPQKFEYSRDNPYGSSNGEGATASSGSDEAADSEPSEKVSPSSEVHLGKSKLSSVRPLGGQDQPAFAKALSRAISGLCTNGSLDCERSEKGARQ